MSLLLVVAVATGCGSDGGDATGDAGARPEATTAASADETAIRERFDEMLQALNRQDGKAACPLMSRSAQQTFTAMAADGSCAAGFAKAFEGGIDEARSPSIVRVDIDGSRAAVFARVPGSESLQRAPFVEEGGEWKVHAWLTD